MVMKVKNGIVNDKENLVKDVSQAFKNNLYSDITFQLADGICISTNKFMLACRVPYFATMLFGSLAEKLPSQPIPLKDCDSNVFKEILKFVWEAEVSLSDMKMPLLLEFLETCRIFCLEELVDTIVDHFRILVNGNKVDFKDCLVALDFTEQHKFIKTSELFIEYIDKNLSSISDIEEFGELSKYSMKKVVLYESRTCSEIVRFGAFTTWLEKNEDLPVHDKIEILNSFDLTKFTDEDLIKKVRKSNLFDVQEICNVLEKKLEIKNQLIEAQDKLVKEKEKLIGERQAVKFNLNCGPNGRTLQLNTRSQFTVPSEFHSQFVNKIEFRLDPDYSYSYTLQSSQDGQDWTSLATCNNVLGATHTVHFNRRKMKFISLNVTKKNQSCGSPSLCKPEVLSFTVQMI